MPKITDAMRLGTADCDVNAIRSEPYRPDMTCGAYSVETDLTFDEVDMVNAITDVGRHVRSKGEREPHNIPAALAIAIVKILGSPDFRMAASAVRLPRRGR